MLVSILVIGRSRNTVSTQSSIISSVKEKVSVINAEVKGIVNGIVAYTVKVNSPRSL